MEPGVEMDRITCEAVGIEPRLHWLVSLPWMSRTESIHSSRADAEARLKELQWLEKKWNEGEIDEAREYPPVSTDPTTALSLVLPALKARGFHAFTLESPDHLDWVAGFYDGEWWRGYGEKPAEAVCRAGLAAIATIGRPAAGEEQKG